MTVERRKSEAWVRPYIDDPTARRRHFLPEVVEAFLAKISRVQPSLNAFISTTEELAYRDAEDAARDRVARPLSGMIVALKDNIDVGGARTTVGSAIYANHVASQDANVVRRLRNAGAIVVGKAAMHEFALGQSCASKTYGDCHNPWDLSRIPGGSSGGSGAAVAADLCVGALGTDTGGSVRVPAALNGVSGLRPTYGRISNRGVFPLAPTFDTVGPMARSVADVAALFDVLRGYDRGDPRSPILPLPAAYRSTEDVTLAVARGDFFDDVDPDAASAVGRAVDVFRERGFKVVDIGIPDATKALDTYSRLLRVEAAAVHRGLDEEERAQLDPEIRSRLEFGASLSGWEVALLYDEAAKWREQVNRMFRSGVTMFLSPTTPSPAPLLRGPDAPAFSSVGKFTQVFSLARLPAVSIPAQPSRGGLPLGIQLAGRLNSERSLLAVADQFQSATDWHLRRPSEAPVREGR
jgi:aspartyl-tRNA(Asn)/glutamyl-tRNA(Gln) amidotransferase subunit A